jgi:hypothetical protein
VSADVAEVVLYNEDSAAPLTITKPAAFATGQVLIFVLSQDSGLLSDLTVPSGWTAVTGGTVDIASQRDKAFYHVYDGAEPSTWDFPYNSGASVAGALYRITGADTTPTLVAATGSISSNLASMDSPTVTPTGADDLLICDYSNQGGAHTLSYTVPSGMTDLGSTQVAGGFQCIAAAKQQLASSSATGAKTWTSLSPTGGAAGTFSIAIKSASGAATTPGGPAPTPLPPHLLLRLAARNQEMWAGAGTGAPVTVDTGLATAGLVATSSAKKVAVVTGTAGLGLAATGGARKASVDTGLAAVGLAGNAVHVQASVDTGLGEVGLSATVTVKKVAVVTCRATLGLAAVDTAKKAAVESVRSALGLAGTDTARKAAVDSGTSALGLASTAIRVPLTVDTGTSPLGLTGRASGAKVAVVAARSALGIAAGGTTKKAARATLLAAGGLAATPAARKVSRDTGTGYVGLLPRFTGLDVRAVTARASLAVWTQHHQCITYRSDIGTTGRPSTGATARPDTGITEEPC